MPALIDYRNDPSRNNCWMLTENCVNYKDVEYYYLCRHYFASPGTWPPATEPTDPNDAFTRPLAELHGKTLGVDWDRADHGPIPTYKPPSSFGVDIAEIEQSFAKDGVPIDAVTHRKLQRIVEIMANLSPISLYECISKHIAISHGAMNFQEVGFRIDVDFEPMWCLFDWETARIAPIYFDLAQVHYSMGKAIGKEQLLWYINEVARLSSIELDPDSVRECIDIAILFLDLRWTCGALKHGEADRVDAFLVRLESVRDEYNNRVD